MRGQYCILTVDLVGVYNAVCGGGTLIIECLLFVIGVFHPCCSGFLVKYVINGEL